MIDWRKIDQTKKDLDDTIFIQSDLLYLISSLKELKTNLMMVQDERNWLRRQLDGKFSPDTDKDISL